MPFQIKMDYFYNLYVNTAIKRGSIPSERRCSFGRPPDHIYRIKELLTTCFN